MSSTAPPPAAIIHPQITIATDVALPSAEELRFLFRCRIAGAATWSCPACGGFTRTPLTALQFLLVCSARHCHRRWGLGQVLYSLAALRNHRREFAGLPDDMILPARTRIDPLPEGEVAQWRKGQRFVHRIRTE